MKPKPVIIVLCFNCLICVTCNVNPGCGCVVYESTGNSHSHSMDTFTSPDYPQIYPKNINCILYTFMGAMDEIIELTFLEFDLQVPITNKCSDYIRFFLDLERPEVNEAMPHNYDLCGNISMIQKKHYSSGRALIFEFHTDDKQQNNIGFRGRYKFLDRSLYEIKGCTDRWGNCIYDCRIDTNKPKQGIIFSPGYPQNYPPNKRCQYMFYAGKYDRVKVLFTSIQLEPFVGNCSYSPDVISVYDGRDHLAPLIAQYCNNMNRIEVISSGKDLLIEFRSDGNKQSQGFAATFEFDNGTFLPRQTTTLQVSTPNYSPLGITSTTTTERPVSPCAGVINCTEVITSQRRKQGYIQSRNFPYDYPESAIHTFVLKGEPYERIQLVFEVVNLLSPKDPTDCDHIDRVEVKTAENAQVLGNYCGSKTPGWLMSDGNHMNVTFVTFPKKSYNVVGEDNQSQGFKAMYRFVTDFGIKTGEQDTKKRGVCKFNYYSSHYPNGTFTSPNYPGKYPRDTVCHYLFYGRTNEKVYISFPFYHVDGIPPQCNSDTKSDSISFSNFNVGLEDEQMTPLCGAKPVNTWKDVESEDNFFRVTFTSNHIYDAEGFDAFFQFREPQDQFVPGSTGSLNSMSPPTRLVCPSLLLTAICVLLWCS